MGRKKTYKLGPILTFRNFPDGYHGMSKSKQEIIDSEYMESLKDKSVKSKHLFYYSEIIWDDEMYITHPEKTKIFIEKAKKVHGNIYDYSLVNYITNMNQIKIICSVHGEFEQRADNHLQGKGCCKCGYEKNHLQRKKKDVVKKKDREETTVITLFDDVPVKSVKVELRKSDELFERAKALAEINNVIEVKKNKNNNRIEERKSEKKIQAEYSNSLISKLMTTIAKRTVDDDKIPDILGVNKGTDKLNINEKEKILNLKEGISSEFMNFLENLKNF